MKNWFACILLFSVLAACGSSDQAAVETECPDNTRHNPILDQCEPYRVEEAREHDALDAGRSGEEVGSGGGDASMDSGFTDHTSGDAGSDAAEDSDFDPECVDEDGDGHGAASCGGDDCDDQNDRVAPSIPEVCDDYDNDCSGENNDGIACHFYANTTEGLYLIDPFKKTAQRQTDVSDLTDVDTASDGTLFGITFSTLEVYDPATQQWSTVGQGFGQSFTANGLAIDQFGVGYMMSERRLYRVDLQSGRASYVGSMGSYYSSGDCVVTKGNILYMTSAHNPAVDTLIKVDGETGAATPVGSIGFDEVWGLTAAWNRLFGLTNNGEVIEIDVTTGQGSLIHRFPNLQFYGAASTPAR